MLWVAVVITILHRAGLATPSEVEPVPRMTTALEDSNNGDTHARALKLGYPMDWA